MHQNSHYVPGYGKAPIQSPPRSLRARKPDPLPSDKQAVSPDSIPVVAPWYAAYDIDTEKNVSFAESLFPIMPPREVHLGRGASESFLSDDDLSPITDSRNPKKTSPLYDLRRQPESGRQGSNIASKKSWSSQDVDSFNDTPVSRRGSWEYKRDMVESRRTSLDTHSKQSWAADGLERGTTRSWTSSSVPEEEIDSGPPVLPPYDDAEEDFLEEFEDYFNHLLVDNVRRDQYPKLDLQKQVYLDYASFSLYSNFQVGISLQSRITSLRPILLENLPVVLIDHTISLFYSLGGRAYENIAGRRALSRLCVCLVIFRQPSLHARFRHATPVAEDAQYNFSSLLHHLYGWISRELSSNCGVLSFPER